MPACLFIIAESRWKVGVWARGTVASSLDFESRSRGFDPRRALFFFSSLRVVRVAVSPLPARPRSSSRGHVRCEYAAESKGSQFLESEEWSVCPTACSLTKHAGSSRSRLTPANKVACAHMARLPPARQRHTHTPVRLAAVQRGLRCRCRLPQTIAAGMGGQLCARVGSCASSRSAQGNPLPASYPGPWQKTQ